MSKETNENPSDSPFAALIKTLTLFESLSRDTDTTDFVNQMKSSINDLLKSVQNSQDESHVKNFCRDLRWDLCIIAKYDVQLTAIVNKWKAGDYPEISLLWNLFRTWETNIQLALREKRMSDAEKTEKNKKVDQLYKQIMQSIQIPD